jgi:serine/threonine protein kinase
MGEPTGTDKTQLRQGPPQPSAPADPRGPTVPVEAGSLIGEYRIDALLGEGGMGTVYSAHQPVIGKWVAVKVLKGELSGDPGLVRRFVDEARAVNKIGHPNIIDIFSFGALPDGRQYFVMELLAGETLATRMERGPLTASEIGRVFGQTLSALAAAHREKIVHRDLKPENLWMGLPRHGQPFTKVLDFGIAKLLEKESIEVTQTGVAMGTPYYMSPEQCLGHNVDHRTDIYALGVMLYQLFAGRLPFEGQSFAEIVTQQITAVPSPPSRWRAVAPPVEELILACLEKDRERRPQSAEELGRQLEAALRAVPSPGQAATSTPEGLSRPFSSRRIRVAIGVAGLLAVILILGWARSRVSPLSSAARRADSALTVLPAPASGEVIARPSAPVAPTPRPVMALPTRTTAVQPPPPTPKRRAPARAGRDDLGIETENPFRKPRLQ